MNYFLVTICSNASFSFPLWGLNHKHSFCVDNKPNVKTTITHLWHPILPWRSGAPMFRLDTKCHFHCQNFLVVLFCLMWRSNKMIVEWEGCCKFFGSLHVCTDLLWPNLLSSYMKGVQFLYLQCLLSVCLIMNYTDYHCLTLVMIIRLLSANDEAKITK